VYELLGGRTRDRIRVYQWIGGDRPSDVGEAAAALADRGLGALKMNATSELERVDSPTRLEEAADRIAAVREATGPEMDVGVDFHGRVSKGMAERLIEEIEPHDPFFVEEPVLPEQSESYPEIAASTAVPLAAGERMYSRWEFKHVFESGGIDIVQPDLSHAGGITEVHKIAAMAEAYDVALAPHCPLGPIAFASSIQIDTCAPNALIQEQSLNIHYNEGYDLLDYLDNPDVFAPVDGHVTPPEAPGLGVDLDLDLIEEVSGFDDWRAPVWRHEDGSISEW
jgi:galactonate dehydratase